MGMAFPVKEKYNGDSQLQGCFTEILFTTDKKFQWWLGGKNMYKAFKMKLYPGFEEEYERRHNELWPEMREMIHTHGGKNYSIFLDRETLTLFGT